MSAVPQFLPLVVHMARNLCTTLVVSNTLTVRGFIFPSPVTIWYITNSACMYYFSVCDMNMRKWKQAI